MSVQALIFSVAAMVIAGGVTVFAAIRVTRDTRYMVMFGISLFSIASSSVLIATTPPHVVRTITLASFLISALVFFVASVWFFYRDKPWRHHGENS